ncbi:LrgB family protein [Alkalibacterium sp. MB6]|uniref:LrgB family protein n=1 Tax=Alkalibacterium sp. MB6 TaxID=2081965 RepID=UPI00137B4C39|nr:LrgB family protein [Alkalibacterium sp. MB6]
MVDILSTNPFFGLFLIFFFYLLGTMLHKRWPNPLFTPLVFSIICIILLLLLLNIPYENFNEGGRFVNMWITPATVALAIKLEKNFDYLKKYYGAILSGIALGVVFHTIILVIMSILFRFDSELVATLFPKSVTTAIALGVSESLGGIVSLTVAIVVFTGVLGTIVGPPIFALFNITDPVAQGVALGSGSHAMGTAKAIELGDVQAAMSGLSIIITGIIIVILAPFLMGFLSTFF